MIKETDLIGLPILKEDHEPLSYEIKDIIYCFKDFRILGLYLQQINSIKYTKILPYTKIKNITEEGILIYSINDIVDADEIAEIKDAINNKSVIGYEIYSNTGEIIGVVKDALLQIRSGKILGFIMSEGLFDDLVNGYSFLPLVERINFYEYRIMLNNEEQLKILPQQGGLKKMLGIDR